MEAPSPPPTPPPPHTSTTFRSCTNTQKYNFSLVFFRKFFHLFLRPSFFQRDGQIKLCPDVVDGKKSNYEQLLRLLKAAFGWVETITTQAGKLNGGFPYDYFHYNSRLKIMTECNLWWDYLK
jgi:hypothetical protein